MDGGGEFEGTPLYTACERGHVEIVQILIEHGANPDRRDNRGWR